MLLGDQAVALGAIHAGITGVYAYPGTPSTEITEYIQTSELATLRGVHSRWCTNEKTAMEAGAAGETDFSEGGPERYAAAGMRPESALF